MLFTAIVAVLLSGLQAVSAQSTAGLDACISDCAQAAAVIVGCHNFTNFDCTCPNSRYFNLTRICLRQKCTDEDLRTARAFEAIACANLVANASTVFDTTAAASGTTAVVTPTASGNITTSSPVSTTPTPTPTPTSPTSDSSSLTSDSSSSSSTSSSSGAATSTGAAIGRIADLVATGHVAMLLVAGTVTLVSGAVIL